MHTCTHAHTHAHHVQIKHTQTHTCDAHVKCPACVRSLTAVPEGVWRINIDAPPDQTVDIGRSDSSEQWWDQVDLTKLILASNQLKELSEDIKYLVALTVLDVSCHMGWLVTLQASILCVWPCVHACMHAAYVMQYRGNIHM